MPPFVMLLWENIIIDHKLSELISGIIEFFITKNIFKIKVLFLKAQKTLQRNQDRIFPKKYDRENS